MLTPEQAAEELLRRRDARRNFRSWCLLCGLQPARHHDLIIEKLQQITDSPTPKYVILLMPPGAAKSTYTSATFPSWYLGRRVGATILASSYSKDLAASFGRRGRNLVEERSATLGYELKSDSKAADEWETTNGGRYFCAGVGAGIAGHRADLGLVDDYLGNQEDADSKNIRDKQWDWFKGDFYPRLKPNASIVIIANRRHEDDLVGRLIKANTADKLNDSPIPPEQWEVIKLPFFAKENDPLGRRPEERLWPEWFTEQQAEQVKRLNPRIRSGLYQQEPAPEDGDFFKAEWLKGYEPQDLPSRSEMRIHFASDHAISKREDANKTCMGGCGVDSKGDIWLLPNIFWKRADAEEQVAAMLGLNAEFKPVTWRAEKGHISMSIGPFLRKIMRETRNYINIREVTPKKDKATRARAIQGFFATNRIHVPKFADWWPDAEHQLLTFPGSSEDDFVDMIAHLGNEVEHMTSPDLDVETPEVLNTLETELTFGRMKERQRSRERALQDA